MWRLVAPYRQLVAPIVAPVIITSWSPKNQAAISELQVVRPLAEEEMDPQLCEKVQFFKGGAGHPGTLGVIPNSVRTMAHRADIAHAFVNLNMAVMKCEGQVTLEFKRLLGYATSLTQGCNY